MADGLMAYETISTVRSLATFRRARGLTPGGVHSPVRAFGSVGGTPRVIERAHGPYVVDVDGHRLIDFVGSWGAAIHGHAFGPIVDAIRRTAVDGPCAGLCHPIEVELAARLTDRLPAAERARLTCSGTEAVMTAVRLARAHTGRPRLVTFAGCYHGHHDAVLARAGSGVATYGLVESPGVSASASAETIVLPYGDATALAETLARHGDTIAAVLVEPIAGNMGLVVPDADFVRTLREATRRAGTILIADEVMTGFRVARGGACEHLGLDADLVTVGKVIGGGLPVGAVAGPYELLSQLAPEGPVYHAGTMAGAPIAVAAGVAALDHLDDAAYQYLGRTAERLAEGLRHAVGPAHCVSAVPGMVGLHLGITAVRDADDVARADHDAFARFFHAALERGVHLPPSAHEAWFVSTAHGSDVIDDAVDRLDDAARAAGVS